MSNSQGQGGARDLLGLEDLQKSGQAGQAESADEDGGLQAGVDIGCDCFGAFMMCGGKYGFDWERMTSGKVGRHREGVVRTNLRDHLVARVQLEIGIPGESLPA